MKWTEKWRTPKRGGLYVPDREGWTNTGTFLVFDGDDGRCLDGWETYNLVVDNGKSVMLGQLFGQSVSSLWSSLTLHGASFTYNTANNGPMNSLGVGTDNTAAAGNHWQLNPVTAGSTSLIAITSYVMTAANAAAATAAVTALWGTGTANFTWAEWGIFAGTTNGTSLMFDRSVFGPFTKTSSVSIQLTATISQT